MMYAIKLPVEFTKAQVGEGATALLATSSADTLATMSSPNAAPIKRNQ